MPYIVYDTDRSIIPGGIHDTQAKANTKASANSDWTAYSGEITNANFPGSTEPGWIITAAGVIVREIPPTTLEELKISLRLAHDHLLDLWDQLNHEAAAHPWAEVTKVHDYFARIHPSNLQIVKVNLIPIPLTPAKIKKYVDELSNGPQDGSGNVLSIPALFSAIASATAVGVVQGVTYVDALTGDHKSPVDSLKYETRENMGLGVTGAPLNVTEAELASGNWIELLT